MFQKQALGLTYTQNQMLIQKGIGSCTRFSLIFAAGLVSNNNFAGSLQYVFFNDISIIYELKRGNPKVHYIGVLEPEFYEDDVEVIPITLPFPSSHIWWQNKFTTRLNISLDFKNARSMGVLAYCEVTTATGHGYWVVSFQYLNR